MESFYALSYKNYNEWLALRGKGMGGSDAAASIGENPYKTNLDLYLEKMGLVIPEDISKKECVIYGKKAEAHIRALFELEHPEYKVIFKEEIKVSTAYDFLRASLDGELIEKETGRKGVLEIKTTEFFASCQKEKWDNQIPQNYYCQILHYLYVTGYDFVVLRVRIKRENEKGKWWVEKDYHFERADVEDDIKFLIDAEIDFWVNYVQKGIEPALKVKLF